MTPHPALRHRLRPGRRFRLALATLVVPLGLGASACRGGLTDTPATSTPPTPSTSEVIMVTGRPLRRRNGRAYRARSRRGHSHLTDRQALWLAPSVRDALADHWRMQGEMEHASVAAFLDLAHRLAALDAPDVLVQGALRAAAQETDHAERCFDLAGRYLGESLRPGRLRRPTRWRRAREIELMNLAVEALRDGVLNEGYAAWLAGRQAERARDRRAREVLQVIARDEAEHAALSAEVLEWCLTSGGARVAAAVHAAAEALPDRLVACVAPAGVDRCALADHGLHDPDADGSGYADLLRLTLAHVPDRERCDAA